MPNPRFLRYHVRMRSIPFAVLATVLTAAVFAQENTVTPKMTTYYMALLRRGPAWSTGSTTETQKIQQGHMAHIRKMAKEDKLILAGPFTDGGELRGVFVFKVGSMEEAKALCDQDPAVQAGRLAVELHPWLSTEGITSPERERLLREK